MSEQSTSEVIPIPAKRLVGRQGNEVDSYNPYERPGELSISPCKRQSTPGDPVPAAPPPKSDSPSSDQSLPTTEHAQDLYVPSA
jgi:hypothetical protein